MGGAATRCSVGREAAGGPRPGTGARRTPCHERATEAPEGTGGGNATRLGRGHADEPQAHRPCLRDPRAVHLAAAGGSGSRAGRGSLPAPPGSIGPFGQDERYGWHQELRKTVVHESRRPTGPLIPGSEAVVDELWTAIVDRLADLWRVPRRVASAPSRRVPPADAGAASLGGWDFRVMAAGARTHMLVRWHRVPITRSTRPPQPGSPCR
jgi:hypothetical protein